MKKEISYTTKACQAHYGNKQEGWDGDLWKGM